MAKATVHFNRIVQDTQNYGCFDQNKDHMVSTLHFSLDVAGKHYDDLYVEVHQPYGTDFESEPIEVSKPIGPYRGPWNHQDFSIICERCYRRAIGAQGSGIRIEGDKNIRMQGNTFGINYSTDFDVPESGAASW